MSGEHELKFAPNRHVAEAAEPTHHEVYYLKDGAIFLVENRLFKIPRHMFEVTPPVFATMLSLPPGPQGAEGESDTAPIRLPQVTCIDFEHLLELLYPLTPHLCTYTNSWGNPQWTSILRLATKWDMAVIRATAIQSLNPIECPFTKLSLGRECDHLPWIKEGFMRLCLRQQLLTATEGHQLTKEDVIAYAAARERILLEVLPLPSNPRTTTEILTGYPGSGLRTRDSHTPRQPAPAWEPKQYLNDLKVKQIVDEVFEFQAT